MLHVWVSHVPPPYSLSPSNNHCVGAGGKCVSLVYTQLRCWMDGGVWASSQHQLHPLAEAEKALFSQHVLTSQCRTWYTLCEKVVICTNQIVIWRLQVFMAIRHKAADLSVYYLNFVWPGCCVSGYKQATLFVKLAGAICSLKGVPAVATQGWKKY